MNTVNVCYECGVYVEARYTVWIPTDYSHSYYEPFCQNCAVEIYGACEEDEI